MNQDQKITAKINSRDTYQGQKWLVEERDACGVGFIAHRQNHTSQKLSKKP
nr:hypothetical protein [Nostoc sp. 'Peltigera malacea cyanobiont' DB3992]